MRAIPTLLAALVLAACAADESAVASAESGISIDTVATTPVVPADQDAPEVAPSSTDTVLTANGWGPLTIGMTRPEVVAAVGDDANPDAVGGPEPDVCDEWQPERQPGMLLMLENGRLSRITLIRESQVQTDRGVGLGDSAASVKSVYGDRAEAMPHKYMAAPAEYITVWQTAPPADQPRGIVYEVGLEGVVTHIHAGGPSIQYVEGCL